MSEIVANIFEQELHVTVVEEAGVHIVRALVPGPPGPRLIVSDNGVAVPSQGKLNFVGFNVTDDPGNNSTVITAAPASVAAFVHDQPSPSTVWTINHLLGYRPSVELFDAGSQEFDGDISHPTINQTIVTLTIATAGFARLI